MSEPIKSVLTCLVALSVLPVSGQLVIGDICDVSGGYSPTFGFGTNTGVNYQITSRLLGTGAGGLSYLQTATTKLASSYSITNNKINVAVAANPGRFTFTTDHATPKDLGALIGTGHATPVDPVIYDLAVKVANYSSDTARTSFGLATADGGIQDWDLGVQLVNNGTNLDLYRRVDAASNPNNTDYNNVIATLTGQAGTEINLRIHIVDAGAESGAGHFNSSYQVYANNTLVYTSAAGDFRFADSATRLVLFDTAPGAGPVTYDNFSLTVIAPPPAATNNLAILSSRFATNHFELTWSSQIGTNYTVLKTANLAAPGWTYATNLTAADTNSTVVLAPDPAVTGFYKVAQLVHTGLAVTNVTAAQRTGTALVDIDFNLTDVYMSTGSITLLISTDGGATYRAAAASFSGDLGAAITPGAHHIVWDAGADGIGAFANVRVKIVADRKIIGADLSLVPGGAFNMGDSKSEGLSCESPVHSVNISDLYVSRREVTKGLWDDVAAWAIAHGYDFQSPAVGANANVPVQQISWHDAVKWCNARSEKEGLPPAYYIDQAWTKPYRNGETNLTEANVRWQGAGYRLPTEAEWEKSARGGLANKRFPWGDNITHTQANYWSTTFEAFDTNGTEGPHPDAAQFPNVLAVGSFQPGGYGLYDMAGNIWEWCWDLYGDTWYSDSLATTANTHGPTSASWGGDRVYRGGSGVDIAWKSRVANRADAPPRFAMGHFGFRVVLSTGENLVSAESANFTLTP